MTSTLKLYLKMKPGSRLLSIHDVDTLCWIIEDIMSFLLFRSTENSASTAQSTHGSHETPCEDENLENDQSAAKGDPTNITPSVLPAAQMNDDNKIKQISSPSPVEAQTSVLKSSEEDYINILLLGESGVGKSTFINAFVNYLAFPTFNDAESHKPIAMIPASFIITTGHEFTEQVVKLDVSGRSDNEDFEHPGQSVTQQCRSYVFPLKQHNGKKLRIIDTPGFGDTRGLEQDDLNMKHILQYINHFSHLNAVCFLLKPNESRVNISFRTCLMQLFNVLGTNICQNILFCFTNSRSTFYTPGNTGTVLKTMIQSISPMAGIPFEKKNVFCFDSESFRYLLALKQGISFDDAERSDYETSWIRSVKEFHRFLQYIEQRIVVHPLNENGQPMKHAQLIQINQLIQPMLQSIQYVHRSVIDQYSTSNDDTIKISEGVSFLIYASAMFASLIKDYSLTLKTDPFLTDLREMHEEEQHRSNRELSEQLQITVVNYGNQLEKVRQKRVYLNSDVSNNVIKIIPQNCEAPIRLELTKTSHENMTNVDYEVPIDSLNGLI